MTDHRITVNGQSYDSAESMPPDVRRAYEEALRTIGPSRAGGPDGSTQVFTSRAGSFGANLVVNRTITVNDRTYGSVDDLPPDMRRLYEEALQGGSTRQARTGLHVSVNLAGPEIRTPGDSNTPPLPFESSTESRLRRIPLSLAIFVVIALALWALLGR
ncbi:MAG TPA: hypothetical protein VJY35_13410 [Candidatus Eisenbacteria bacterium]|nr:hypothetical protein [Candidatus Eisenbacteria bacterium]